MSINHNDVLKVAEFLYQSYQQIQSPPSGAGSQLISTDAEKEALLRSAISRYYYAAFLCARRFARDVCGVTTFDKNRIHQQVLSIIGSRDNPQVWLDKKAVSDNFRELKNLRLNSDYDIDLNTRDFDFDAEIGRAKRLSEEIIRVLCQVSQAERDSDMDYRPA
jgi:uncharacterized protein (UPF0332 family)